ncbi:hypothetical protein EDB82DRAFT_59456 [Fusarium venenatum]|uniref:uncharacterized protein n=1 Tax=Fusarium venenatum TaxID=56646 RepID=UPI001D49CB05|nr:hypothetical protein EDB82DRAFT_59456 [Fusarium venenatum]
MNALVAPEVWEALLPVRKASPASHNQARNDLKILAAVCGIHDVTSTLQALVIDEEMAIRIDAIKGLVNEDIYKKELPLLGWNLSFIYQYGAGSMRICSANYRKKSSESVHISKTSDHPIVTSRESIGRKFPLVAIVYGGSIYNSKDQLRTVEKHISQGCKNDFTHEECIVFDDTLFGANWNGVEKTGVVFFTNQIDSCVHATVGLERQCCLLKEYYQLAELRNHLVPGIDCTKDTDATTTQGLRNPISLMASGLKIPLRLYLRFR